MARKPRIAASGLTDKQRDQIAARYAHGDTLKSLMEAYGISYAEALQIAVGRAGVMRPSAGRVPAEP